MLTINYLSHPLISYPLHDIDEQQEYETIKCILYNNKYNPHTLDRSINTITTKLQTQKSTVTSPQTHHEEHTTQQKEKTIWSSFTYIGPETTFITKLFKHTNIKVAYKEKILSKTLYLTKHNIRLPPIIQNSVKLEFTD